MSEQDRAKLAEMLSKTQKSFANVTDNVLQKMDPIERSYFILGEDVADRSKKLSEILNSNVSGFTDQFFTNLKSVIEESENASVKQLKVQKARLLNLKTLFDSQEGLVNEERDALSRSIEQIEEQLGSELKRKSSFTTRAGGFLSTNKFDIASVMAGIAGNNPVLTFLGKSVGDLIQAQIDGAKEAKEQRLEEALKLREQLKSDAELLQRDFARLAESQERESVHEEAIRDYLKDSRDILEDSKVIQLDQYRLAKEEERRALVEGKISRLKGTPAANTPDFMIQKAGLLSKVFQAAGLASIFTRVGPLLSGGIGGLMAGVGAALLAKTGPLLKMMKFAITRFPIAATLRGLPLVGFAASLGVELGERMKEKSFIDAMTDYLMDENRSFLQNVGEKAAMGATAGLIAGPKGAVVGGAIGGAVGLTGSLVQKIADDASVNQIEIGVKSLSAIFGPLAPAIMMQSKWIAEQIKKRGEPQSVVQYDSNGNELTPEEVEKRKQKVKKKEVTGPSSNIDQYMRSLNRQLSQQEALDRRSKRRAGFKSSQESPPAVRSRTGQMTGPTRQSRVSMSELSATLSDFGISDIDAQANILAQIQAESGFIPQSENLNYTPDRLFELFGKGNKFGNTARIQSLKDAEKLVAQGPEAVANLIYGGRLGNAEDEGFMYRGRGLIQLTGKDNYARMGKMLGVDLVNNPDLASDPKIAAQIAAAYFASKKNVDLTDIDAVTRATGPATRDFEKRRQIATNIRQNLERDSTIQNSDIARTAQPVQVVVANNNQSGAPSGGGIGGNTPSTISATRNDEPIHVAILRSQYAHIVN